MKKLFSNNWISSKQPRKQRKYRANAPLHIKHKFLSAPLSKELREKYGKRNLPLRNGDEVLVMRGSFKKKRAKVISIDLKNTRVELEKINRTKKEGAKVSVKFHPSSLQIQVLALEDRKRLKRFNLDSDKDKSKTGDKKSEGSEKKPDDKKSENKREEKSKEVKEKQEKKNAPEKKRDNN